MKSKVKHFVSCIFVKKNLFLNKSFKVTRMYCFLSEYTKQSLDRTWKNYLSNDWLCGDKSSSFPMDKFYVDLKWTKTVKGVLSNKRKGLRNMYDVLHVAGPEAINTLIKDTTKHTFYVKRFLCLS